MTRQLTCGAYGHILTNTAVFSPDGKWIVFDDRSDPAGSVFDGQRILRVATDTGKVETLYESRDGACCGVATVCPASGRVVFILGPEHPTPDYSYGPSRRRGVIVDPRQPGQVANLDARDLSPSFTAGALRGGTHLHTFSHDGRLVAFTYDDDIICDPTQRNIGLTVLGSRVNVPRTHPRNHDGHWSVCITQTTGSPTPGSDEIARASEEGWVGRFGYLDNSRKWRRAIAFQGRVAAQDGRFHDEVFLASLPDRWDLPGHGPLAGTKDSLPSPPAGVTIRRLTFTSDQPFRGIQGPRHWLRSPPDGSRIGLLRRDNDGVVQLAAVPTLGGPIRQLTRRSSGVTTSWSWSACGQWIAFGRADGVWMIDIDSGEETKISDVPPRPEACVLSPDGQSVAFVADVSGRNQVFLAPVPVKLRVRRPKRHQSAR